VSLKRFPEEADATSGTRYPKDAIHLQSAILKQTDCAGHNDRHGQVRIGQPLTVSLQKVS